MINWTTIYLWYSLCKNWWSKMDGRISQKTWESWYFSQLNSPNQILAEWPHRHCACLMRWRSRVRLKADTLRFYSHIFTASRAHIALSCKGRCVTKCQLDLPPLMPFSSAGCGRLQLGVAHLATSVAILQVNDWPRNL